VLKSNGFVLLQEDVKRDGDVSRSATIVPIVSSPSPASICFKITHGSGIDVIFQSGNMNTSRHESLTNYITYRDLQNKRNFIGHYDFSEKTIQPLAFISGTPIDNLYQVIEVGEANILPSGNPFPASSVKILPPLAERDVLCVGKNYAEHAKEFNNSGFDSSDKVDTPSHPVIFTKRFTSVIADGENILSHPGFTQTLDYEGEVGVIIGKSGFRIHEEEAASHVWGYTIINDVTARERQRDHKQFYIGKSADTFCPMVCSAS
jgi:hypothetical protein